MAEHPIFFTGDNIQAILDRRKTQTRRVMKPQPIGPCKPTSVPGGWYDVGAALIASSSGVSPFVCPYGVPGDQLYWANEPIEFIELYDQGCLTRSGAKIRSLWDHSERVVFTPGKVGVLHGRVIKRPKLGRWRGRCLPIEWARDWRWPLTDVRAQRVQEISEEDAVAEGVFAGMEYPYENREVQCAECDGMGVHGAFGEDYGVTEVDCCNCDTVQKRFRILWDSINAKRGFGFDVNPWVFALTFELAR